MGRDELCMFCGGPMIPRLDFTAGTTMMVCQNQCIFNLHEDAQIEIGPYIVDESTISGQVIAELIDLPWYVAFFWIVVGMVFMGVAVLVLLILWHR